MLTNHLEDRKRKYDRTFFQVEFLFFISLRGCRIYNNDGWNNLMTIRFFLPCLVFPDILHSGEKNNLSKGNQLAK